MWSVCQAQTHLTSSKHVSRLSCGVWRILGGRWRDGATVTSACCSPEDRCSGFNLDFAWLWPPITTHTGYPVSSSDLYRHMHTCVIHSHEYTSITENINLDGDVAQLVRGLPSMNEALEISSSLWARHGGTQLWFQHLRGWRQGC